MGVAILATQPEFCIDLLWEGVTCGCVCVLRYVLFILYSIYRHVPVDMAAFAIHLNVFLEKPEVKVGYQPGNSKRSKRGFMESDLIKSIGSSRDQIECRGVPNEVCMCRVCYYVDTYITANLYVLTYIQKQQVRMYTVIYVCCTLIRKQLYRDR